MNNLDESKYTIEMVFENQKVSDQTERLLLRFHESLSENLNRRRSVWSATTHKIGVAYFYGRKAFIWVNVRQDFLSLKFFTGIGRRVGLKKGNWNNKDDNRGSETFRVNDVASLKEAIRFSLDAYDNTVDWKK